MALRINDTAPDFTAESTQGTIHFHDSCASAIGVHTLWVCARSGT